MNKLLNLNWNLAVTIIVIILGSLLPPNSYAKSLYKSVNADGKITYSNHPTTNSKTAQNISSLKGSPKFSITDKQSYRTSSKS